MSASQGLSLSDVGASSSSSEAEGLTVDEVLDTTERIDPRKYLHGDKWFDVDNALVVDVESYALNSKIRTIQVYSIQDKKIWLLVNGKVEDREKLEEKVDWGGELEVVEKDSEKGIIEEFGNLLKEKQQPLIGHNLAHFDLGLIDSKVREYGISAINFYGYTVGSGGNSRRMYFSYLVDEEENFKEYSYEERTLICDTLQIAFSLHLEDCSLEGLAEDTPYPKKEVDYEEFEKDVLDVGVLEYSIYDVLSIPYVYENLREFIERPTEFLKPDLLASQLCYDHVWMKGSGSLAESFLNEILGRVDPDTPDHLTKYLGGLTRSWKSGLTEADSGVIRELDLASAYPFAIAKQGLLDILNGDFEFYENESVDPDVWDDLIYSAVGEFEAKESTQVIVEISREKDSDRFNQGFFKTFERDQRVSDTQHDLGVVKLQRGKKIVLTKGEVELNRCLNEKGIDALQRLRVKYGIKSTGSDLTERYLDLYELRLDLKDRGEDAEVGIKYLINAVYGKLASMKGKWFNLACAGAITSFVRQEILKVAVKSDEIADLLYSDTDSVYLKLNKEKYKEKIQDKAEEINDLPSEFGVDNLEDEGEEILAFAGIKRKNYDKILKEDDDVILHQTGISGKKDVKWLDALYRLLMLIRDPFEDSEDLENWFDIVNQKITEVDLDFSQPDKDKFEDLAQRIFENYRREDLSDYLQVDERLVVQKMKSIHFSKSVNYDHGTFWRYVKEEWEEEVTERGLYEKEDKLDVLEKLKERRKEKEELEKEIKEKEKKFGDYFDDKTGWQEFYELLKGGLESEGQDFDYKEVYRNYAYYWRQLGDQFRKPNLRESALGSDTWVDVFSKNVLGLFENFRADQVGSGELVEWLNDISPNSVRVFEHYEEDRKYFEKEIDILKDEKRELENEIEDLENEINDGVREGFDIEAYVGLFFEINSDYSFEKKGAEEYDFSLNYELYEVSEIESPVIRCKDYMKPLTKEIDVDTFFIKTFGALNFELLDDDEKKRKITSALYGEKGNSWQVGRRDHHAFYQNPLMVRLRVDPESNEVCVKQGNNEYANINLFFTPKNRFTAGFRVNKVKIFDEKRNLFTLYRVFDNLSSVIQKFIEEKLEEANVDFDCPRFLYAYQLDVSAEASEELFEGLIQNIHKSIFQDNWEAKGRFQQVAFTDYLAFTCYDKKNSAEKKINYKKMTENEKSVFEEEAEEGYRGEVKLKLRRGFYEALSYALVFDSMNYESFLELVKIRRGKKIFDKKYYEFEYSTLMDAYFEFSSKKCVVLFESEGNIVWLPQGVKGRGCVVLRLPLELLESHGFNFEKYPPHDDAKQSYEVENGGIWKVRSGEWLDYRDMQGVDRIGMF